jgi:tetratricopeptide repeat protein 21B
MASLLEKLSAYVPGVPSVQIAAARIKYVARNFSGAQEIITRCLNIDPTYSDANILAAQIALAQENYSAAQQALQRAISNNFTVHDWPSFCLLRARVLNAVGESTEALQALDHAIRVIKQGKAKKGTYDYVAILLEKAIVHSDKNEKEEAASIIEDLMEKYRNTPDEGRVIIANAKLAIKRNDIETALNILSMIPANDPNFTKAKVEMAYIHLNQRNDRKGYMRCMEELIEVGTKSASSYMSLGEAYINIQEPEMAIKQYESALEIEPGNAELKSKIGKAMVTTHCYEEAISYYKEALEQDPTKTVLRHDLAELLFQLKQDKNAEQVLIEGIELIESQKSSEVNVLIGFVQTLLLLSKVRSDGKDAVADLLKARVIQNQVLQKSRNVQQELLLVQKKIAASICYDLGQYHAEGNEPEKALDYYNESLEMDETYEKSMLALANIHLRKGDLDACQTQCYGLLRLDPEHEQANMMLADIMFRKNKYDEAIEYFGRLLEKKPNNYNALVQLIKLLRRAGDLQKSLEYVEAAERASNREHLDPGLHYCKGLYQLYSLAHPREALREFNLCRNHPEWAEQAIIHMINIYLSPENAGSTNVLENATGHADKEKASQNNADNIQAAEKLIDALNLIITSGHSHNKAATEMRKQVLQGYLLMSKGNKNDMDNALNIFAKLVTDDKDNIPALVAMATAFQMLKQTPKARNNLKRISKMEASHEEIADDFERGLLILSDIYISSAKYDLAQDQLKKALQANQSCAKAWELMGLIYEKEQSFVDASGCYEKAWVLTNSLDPGVGYKLAFNYLKAKKSIEAIDVCHKVLASHPDYPKIRKEILEKARLNLKP